MSPPRRRRSAEEEPLLFDLPLVPPGSGGRGNGPATAGPVQSDLFAAPDESDLEVGPDDESDGGFESESMAPAVASGPVLAGIGSRWVAGCADALLHVGVLAGLYLGLIALEVEPRIGHWPAFATLLVAFSFLSSVVSLAFWGQTAGMAWRGLQTRDRLQRPLTFRQATLRWAGGLLTFATAGVPLLLALGGASLSDWMSRSVTYSLNRN